MQRVTVLVLCTALQVGQKNTGASQGMSLLVVVKARLKCAGLTRFSSFWIAQRGSGQRLRVLRNSTGIRVATTSKTRIISTLGFSDRKD